jgi:hypothetical protein
VTAGYITRLTIELLATLFLVSLVLGVFAAIAGRLLPRLTRWFTARSVADLALALRLLPFVASLVITFAICAPSYLRFEPRAYDEAIGWPCVLAALLGAALGAESIARATLAIKELRRFDRQCRSRLVLQDAPQAGPHQWLIRFKDPIIVCAGFLRPRFIVSDRVHDLLLPSQMELVFAHEAAHARSLDNLKRLLIVLAPDLLPASRCMRGIERTWGALAEWAADDYAARENPEWALTLAETLVLLAKSSGATAGELHVASLVRSFALPSTELLRRVERLINFGDTPRKKLDISSIVRISTLLSILAICAVVSFTPSILQIVHAWLEQLIH